MCIPQNGASFQIFFHFLCHSNPIKNPEKDSFHIINNFNEYVKYFHTSKWSNGFALTKQTLAHRLDKAEFVN